MYVSSVRISTSTRLLLSLSVRARLESSTSQSSASGNCLTLVTLLFSFVHFRKPSRLVLRLYDFLTPRRTHIYLPLSEIPGPRQKAGAAHELKPLSIPPVVSRNLQDPVFAPCSLGLTRNKVAISLLVPERVVPVEIPAPHHVVRLGGQNRCGVVLRK